MLKIDASTDFGARVERRLREDWIGWLTTVATDQTPQPSPIWFLWDGETILVYSRPDTPKLRNIARNPRVALNLDGDGKGGDIVILTGAARVDRDAPGAADHTEYLEKYRQGIKRIGMTPEQFAGSYSVPIRMTPTKLRGH